MDNNGILFVDDVKIPEIAHKGNSGIRKICIGKNVRFIGAEAFSMCPNLESIEVDENNRWFTSKNGCNAIIDKTSGVLLAGCYKTEIPEYVKEIGPFAFCGQTKLKKLTIPAHIHRVSAYAFDGCSGLVELKIEKGVESIGEYCFKNCTNLETIYLSGAKIDIDATVFGVIPFNWDDMHNSKLHSSPIIAPCFERILDIFFDGTMEEYYENSPVVEWYLSGSLIESKRIIYVHCKDGRLTYNKWQFQV
ncbi:MAG: leucine-rich repeat domain-containing protein [Ruminococcaceae bacterium]|nr:leucine-rich repeat domain-containing protein [Oscillospiraceae bacterium]